MPIPVADGTGAAFLEWVTANYGASVADRCKAQLSAMAEESFDPHRVLWEAYCDENSEAIGQIHEVGTWQFDCRLRLETLPAERRTLPT
jgi:hypothetical protein